MAIESLWHNCISAHFFRSPEKCEPQSSLEGTGEIGKVSQTVRVFFLSENHDSPHDRSRNLAFLKRQYSFTRGDIILVEDDQSKIQERLNLEQIEGIATDSCRIMGWDDSVSGPLREKAVRAFREILAAAEKVESAPTKHLPEIAFLLSMMKQQELKAYEAFLGISSNDLAEDPAKISLLVSSCRGYVEKAKQHLSWKYFQQRQESLQGKILACLAESKTGSVFVCLGKKHLDTQDQRVSASVEQLFASILPFGYCVVA